MSENQNAVQIEIGIEKLESLFSKGQLCTTDFRCLNCESKKCIWNLCLTSCAKRMQCKLTNFECYTSCEKSSEYLLNDSSILVYVEHEHLAKLA